MQAGPRRPCGQQSHEIRSARMFRPPLDTAAQKANSWAREGTCIYHRRSGPIAEPCPSCMIPPQTALQGITSRTRILGSGVFFMDRHTAQNRSSSQNYLTAFIAAKVELSQISSMSCRRSAELSAFRIRNAPPPPPLQNSPIRSRSATQPT